MLKRNVLRIVGIVFWMLAVGGVVISASKVNRSSSAKSTSLAQYLAGPSSHVAAIDPTSRLQTHDPVFFQDDAGVWKQIGYVESTSPETTKIAWHAADIDPGNVSLSQYRSSRKLEDVIAAMLPPDQRQQIADRISEAMSMHGDDLAGAFVPLVQRSFAESLPVIESEFRLSVVRHRDEFDALAEKFNDKIVRERLMPLARREIVPIIREHGQPPAEEIGRELWNQASIWRFGWRAVYDQSPLPKQDLLQEEWDRFVDEQAVPIFESRMDEVVVAVQKILTDVTNNEAVRAELSGVAGEIAADAQVQALVRKILRESFVENAALREVWTRVWTSEEARAAFDMAGDRLEPVARKIGDDLFGTREGGINPNFARVLRNQILGKDRRWIVATRNVTLGNADSIPIIEPVNRPMAFPIVHLAAGEITGEITGEIAGE
jgi:hypothetical protein